MVTKHLKIINQLGLHARASAKFVATASRFAADIKVTKLQQTVNAKSIMGVMMLAANHGSEIIINAEGDDAQEAVNALEELVAAKFGEEA